MRKSLSIILLCQIEIKTAHQQVKERWRGEESAGWLVEREKEKYANLIDVFFLLEKNSNVISNGWNTNLLGAQYNARAKKKKCCR